MHAWESPITADFNLIDCSVLKMDSGERYSNPLISTSGMTSCSYRFFSTLVCAYIRHGGFSLQATVEACSCSTMTSVFDPPSYSSLDSLLAIMLDVAVLTSGYCSLDSTLIF